MLVLLSWLKEYIDLPYSPKEIGALLTSLGIEVDHIKQYPGFQGVLVARITKVSKHPQAESLSLLEVNDGTNIHTLVSADLNLKEGMLVPFAPVGAKLQTSLGSFIEISSQNIRGVNSSGMLCSEKELGISEDGSSVLVLSSEYHEGERLDKKWEDVCFEVSLTPNLGHVLSIIGIAKELSAATKIRLKEKSLVDPKTFKDASFKVVVEDQKSCPRYSSLLLSNINVKPSPFWLRKRLFASGIRPVNNIVDTTNLISHELGQPLHAFDYDKMHKDEIRIRNARSNEEMLFLDGVLRKLPEGAIVIGDKAEALGGIMGGSDSAVSSETHTCLLEAAYFDPVQIRKARKAVGVATDASWRFERGCDPQMTVKALSNAYSLIHELLPEAKVEGFVDCYKPKEPIKVQCRQSRACKVLGYDVSMNEIESIFNRLGFRVSTNGDDLVTVEVPSWRHDIKEEIDLIEEIFRLSSKPEEFVARPYQGSTLEHHPLFTFEKKLRNISLASGLQEFVTCNLISPRLVEIVQNHPIDANSLVKVLNPMSQEQSILRPSMLPGFLDIIKRNFNHRSFSVQGFEIGDVYFKERDKYEEESVIAFILTGDIESDQFTNTKREVDFFDLKGVVENHLDRLLVETYQLESSNYSVFHPGRQAKIISSGIQIGSLGEIHPSVLRSLDIDQRVLFAELNVLDISSLPKRQEIAKELPLYPSSERDWTITVSDNMKYGELISAIKSLQSPILESVDLQAIFKHEKLGLDKMNITLHFVFRDLSKTVSQEVVDNEFQRLITYAEQHVIRKL